MRTKLIQDGAEKTFAVVFEAGEEVVAGSLRFATDQSRAGSDRAAAAVIAPALEF